MAYEFDVRAGVFKHNGMVIDRTAYSGNGRGLNNPDMENVVGVGPLPRGRYEIGDFTTHPKLGVLVARLTPQFKTARALLDIHGDNEAMNHTASDGCLILPHGVRLMMSQSGDHELDVV
jgi:hypothetical protein